MGARISSSLSSAISSTLATPTSAHISSLQPDEDFINRSLLVSLHAGYDIPYSSDSDRPVAASCGSSSNSSSGSPSVPFHLSKYSSYFHLTRPESASDKANHSDSNKTAQDNMYNMHSSSASSLFNNSTNTSMHFSEFSGEFDSKKHSQFSGAKSNCPNNLNLSREQFTNFPNTNRPRHQNSQSLLNSTAPPFREPGTFFPPNSDSYSNPLMSPSSHDPRVNFDLSRASGLGPGHKNFQDTFTGSAGVMPSHQGAGKQGFSQPPQGHSAFTQSAPFINGMHSQTPYGPHIPTNVTQPTTAPAGNPSTSANYAFSKDNANNQEEISTIFVVGFPEDMQVSKAIS